MDYTRRLPDIIRKNRIRVGLTQAQVSDQLGFKSADYICLVELGLRNLDLDKIPALAEILHLNPVDLCRVAVHSQYPALAKCLFGGKAAPAAQELAAAGVAYRFQYLEPGVRQMVINMIDALYEQKHKPRQLKIA